MGHGGEDKVCNWWGGSRTSLKRVNGPNLNDDLAVIVARVGPKSHL